MALDEARDAWQALHASSIPPQQWTHNPTTQTLLEQYRFALTSFIQQDGIALSRNGMLDVRWETEQPGHFAPETFTALIPAPLRSLHGMKPRQTRAGLGAAIIGTPQVAPLANYPKSGPKVSTTFLITFEEPRPTLRLIDTRIRPDWPVARGAVLLDFDGSLPVAMSVGRAREHWIGILGFVSVASRLERAGIYLMEPYDPDRIPVLMIHGLQSSPLIWRNIAAAISTDLELQPHYQLWAFYYPTGLSILDSAEILRESLDELRNEVDPSRSHIASNRMVIIGHSMGGILTRSLVANVGTRVWEEISDATFEEIPLNPNRKAQLANRLFWKPDFAVEQAIFIATPHKGSNLATGLLGTLAKFLIHLPREILEFQAYTMGELSAWVRGDVNVPRVQSSIVGLAPNNALSRSLDASPFTPGVGLHSIIGDRGRRGALADSSDGVVPYWSSHLPEAHTELVVPAGHSAFKHPEAVERILQVLRHNLEENGASRRLKKPQGS